MRERRRNTWTAWIAIAAFLLSGIWPALAIGQERRSPFGDDICSASRASDRSAPASAHPHKHCAECLIAAALQFGAPSGGPILLAAPPSRFNPAVPLESIASVSLVVGTSPRGPPASL